MIATLFRSEFSKLSRSEQLDLLLDLWEEFTPDEENLGISEAQRAELDRRWAKYEAAPDTAVPWDELRSELASRLE